jgi:cell division protein FtsI (penicillin-binding protein 3)
MLYNAVANNGKMMKPYLVSAIREYGKDIKTFQPTVLVEQIAPEKAVAQLRSCAEEVVVTGTGKHIQSPYYKIAGKTGTAQVADKGIRYTDRVYQGSFVGYFPADEPKYTIAVVIRTRKNAGSYYGGTLAAPVFRMISDKIFANGMGKWDEPLDSIARRGRVSIAAGYATTGKSYVTMLNALGKHADVALADMAHLSQLVPDSNRNISIQSKAVFHGLVPDVKGLALKDAVYILENQGLKVTVKGKGIVQGQTIAPGSRITKGQHIIILLS